ncbi:pentapeptide repeat-containing protein [Floridanema aerugineum]|uniref:Pentapeptide repeat-containing protein n=1 Tax=Floridaenema aerugineum BLCC-F46 TaxID=3153654 RepID=A0ABV4X349_9CYAN
MTNKKIKNDEFWLSYEEENRNFQNRDLRNVNFIHRVVKEADFRRANLKNANLSYSSFLGVNLCSANLQEANLQGAILWNNDYYYREIVNLQEANLKKANLQQANLQGANFTCSNLQDANLKQANLRGANLTSANLEKANLQWADLAGANLTGANLQGANFQGAKLHETRLPSLEKMQGANFQEATLQCVELTSGENLHETLEKHQYIIPFTRQRKAGKPEKKLIANTYLEIINSEENQKILDPNQQTILTKISNIAEAQNYLDTEGYYYPKSIEEARFRIIESIARRQGQTKFRQNLLEAYENCCAISGCHVKEALEAAHIIPYSETENNHPSNGLLLRADIHTLFDLYLVAINPETMTVHFASSLLPAYKDFDKQLLRLPKNKDFHPKKDALEWRWKQYIPQVKVDINTAIEELLKAMEDW